MSFDLSQVGSASLTTVLSSARFISNDDVLVSCTGDKPTRFASDRLPASPEIRFLQIADLNDSRLRLNSILPVTVEFWGNTVVACHSDSEQFGYGASESEALESLRNCLVDLYFLLKDEGESNLGPLPARLWRFLKTHVDEV